MVYNAHIMMHVDRSLNKDWFCYVDLYILARNNSWVNFVNFFGIFQISSIEKCFHIFVVFCFLKMMA